MKKLLSALLIILLITSSVPISNVAGAFDQEESQSKQVTNSNQVVYDIYVTIGTLPTIYAGLNSFTTNNESYMWFERKGTLDTTYLPSHVNLIAHEKSYSAEVMNEIINKIKELYDSNPDAHFNLFMDDLRVQFELQMLVANNIPAANYNVHLLSDGTATYYYFKSWFTSEGTYANWTRFQNQYDDIVRRVESGEQNVININNNVELFWAMFNASQKSNVDYWMQFPELLVSNDAQVTEETGKMNTIKIAPYDIYNTLSQDKKEQFIKSAGIDKQHYDRLFNSSSKPNLIISGASLDNEQGTFEEVIKRIVNDFGNEYDLFFKPHPAWDPTKNEKLIKLKRKEFLDGQNITLLPAQLPMETLLWAYPEVKIGGYSSSLYMSAAKEQTIFFIADSKESLVIPLPELYDLGHFGKAKFYSIKADTKPDPDEDLSKLGLLELSAVHDDENIPLTVAGSVYTSDVSNNVDYIVLNIKPIDNNSKVSVIKDNNNVEITKIGDVFKSNPIAMNVGENKISLVITSADEKNSVNYNIVINRKSEQAGGDTNGGISGGGGFTPPTTTYIETMVNGSVVNKFDISTIENGVENVVVDLSEYDKNLSIRMNLNILSELQENDNKFITLNLDGFAYRIPTNLLDVIAYDNNPLGKENLNGNEKFELSIRNLTDEEIKDIQKELDGSVLSDIIDTTLTLTNSDGETFDVEHFNQYIQLMLLTKGDIDLSEGHTSAIVITDNVDTELSYLTQPVKLVNIDDKQYAVISTLTNGSYVITRSVKAFEDIAGHWAESYIKESVDRQFAKGVDKDKFAPNRLIKRSEFIAMIVRSLGLPVDSTSDDARWYEGELNAALESGLLEGIKVDPISINQYITRSEMVIIASQISKMIGGNIDNNAKDTTLTGFADSDILAEKEKAAFSWAIENGVIKGIPNNRDGSYILSPKGSSTRAEAVTIILRVLKNHNLIDA